MKKTKPKRLDVFTDQKRAEAAEAELDTRRATRAAAELRQNPQYQTQQNQHAEQRKQWTLKAAAEFPELAKARYPNSRANSACNR